MLATWQTKRPFRLPCDRARKSGSTKIRRNRKRLVAEVACRKGHDNYYTLSPFWQETGRNNYRGSTRASRHVRLPCLPALVLAKIEPSLKLAEDSPIGCGPDNSIRHAPSTAGTHHLNQRKRLHETRIRRDHTMPLSFPTPLASTASVFRAGGDAPPTTGSYQIIRFNCQIGFMQPRFQLLHTF